MKDKYAVYCKAWMGPGLFFESREVFYLDTDLDRLAERIRELKVGWLEVGGDGVPVNGDEVVIIEGSRTLYQQVKNGEVTMPHDQVHRLYWTAFCAEQKTQLPPAQK